MPKYNCPKCGGNAFDIDPWAYLNAKGRDVKNLPVKCRDCGFEAKPNDFDKHKPKEEPKK